MKRLLWAVLMMVVLMFGVAAAQGPGPAEVLTVNVPFAFVVNGTTLPAGSYEFRITPNLIAIRTATGEFKVHVISSTRNWERTDTGHLVFQDRDGKKYLVELHHGSGTLQTFTAKPPRAH